MQQKKTKLFTISEVTKMFGLKNLKTKKPSTHVLRYWETKFKQLKPLVLDSGRRYYTEKNIEVVKMIFFLLKEQGLTINGAINIMKNAPKQLDGSKSLSIKGDYYKRIIKNKSKKILNKTRWLKKHTLKFD